MDLKRYNKVSKKTKNLNKKFSFKVDGFLKIFLFSQ